jgi:hypothetical protein
MSFSAVLKDATADPDPVLVTGMLQSGLGLVADLNRKLQSLDDLMLSGRPEEIAEAAQLVEAALKLASPTFGAIALTMEQLGARNLQAAAESFRRAEQNDAASLTDALRLALGRFAKRSVEAGRRAQHLNRGLTAALQTLQELGVQESGRLIAEA